MKQEAIKDFNRVINALALELPEAVWNDVNYRWIEFQNKLKEHESPQHPEQGFEKEVYEAMKIYIRNHPRADELFDILHGKSSVPENFNTISQPAGEQPPAVEGELYRFIKAGERLPGKEGRYFIRVQMAAYEKSAYFNGEYFEDQFTNKDIEWLEKLASQPPPPLPVEQEQAVEILKELCQLKHYKDTVGKDSVYEKAQPEAWKRANDFLNTLIKK